MGPGQHEGSSGERRLGARQPVNRAITLWAEQRTRLGRIRRASYSVVMVNASMTGAELHVPHEIELASGDVIELEIEDRQLKAEVTNPRPIAERGEAACSVRFIDAHPEALHTLGGWMGRPVPHGEMRD